MQRLTKPDLLHLEAAVGWLELGNWREANEELELIAPKLRAHPDVVSLRCKIYLAAEKWECAAEVANGLCTMLPGSPFGPLHLAHALRQLDRTEQAKASLIAVADKFPDEWRLSYQLACYYSSLGERKEALAWLERAISIAGKLDIRQKALDEPDLEQLWADISEV